MTSPTKFNTNVKHLLDHCSVNQRDENGVIWRGRIVELNLAIYPEDLARGQKAFKVLIINAKSDNPEGSPRSLYSQDVISLQLARPILKMWHLNDVIEIKMGANRVISMRNPLQKDVSYISVGQNEESAIFL